MRGRPFWGDNHLRNQLAYLGDGPVGHRLARRRRRGSFSIAFLARREGVAPDRPCGGEAVGVQGGAVEAVRLAGQFGDDDLADLSRAGEAAAARALAGGWFGAAERSWALGLAGAPSGLSSTEVTPAYEYHSSVFLTNIHVFPNGDHGFRCHRNEYRPVIERI